MATAVVSCPTQLSFPWMQCEASTKRTRKSNKADLAKKTSHTRTVVKVSTLPAPAAFSSSLGEFVSPAASVTNVKPVLAIQPEQRVGEVRIGKVMMQLLKRYGITEDEISSVLASIAQENCGNLAG